MKICSDCDLASTGVILCSGVYDTMGIKAALPKYELYFYNTVLCVAVLWATSWIFEVSSCEYEGTHTHLD